MVVIVTLFVVSSIQAAPLAGNEADSQLKVVTESNNHATDEFNWRFCVDSYFILVNVKKKSEYW